MASDSATSVAPLLKYQAAYLSDGGWPADAPQPLSAAMFGA
jgi:hypothetical protein